MSSQYLRMANASAHALRNLMDHPNLDVPRVSFCSSSARDLGQAVDLVALARDMQRDLIHLTVDDVADAGHPSAVSLVVRRGPGAEWLRDARLYAAGSDAPVELLAGGRRWYMTRGVLRAGKLPPAHRRRAGEAIATKRWRAATATMAAVTFTGAVWVPPGRRFAEAIPEEHLRLAD